MHLAFRGPELKSASGDLLGPWKVEETLAGGGGGAGGALGERVGTPHCSLDTTPGP